MRSQQRTPAIWLMRDLEQSVDDRSLVMFPLPSWITMMNKHHLHCHFYHHRNKKYADESLTRSGGFRRTQDYIDGREMMRTSGGFYRWNPCDKWMEWDARGTGTTGPGTLSRAHGIAAMVRLTAVSSVLHTMVVSNKRHETLRIA
jgi:hypothetical protein